MKLFVQRNPCLFDTLWFISPSVSFVSSLHRWACAFFSIERACSLSTAESAMKPLFVSSLALQSTMEVSSIHQAKVENIFAFGQSSTVSHLQPLFELFVRFLFILIYAEYTWINIYDGTGKWWGSGGLNCVSYTFKHFEN